MIRLTTEESCSTSDLMTLRLHSSVKVQNVDKLMEAVNELFSIYMLSIHRDSSFHRLHRDKEQIQKGSGVKVAAELAR